MTDTIVRGSKGSESSHTPVESPDSLINTSYANILDAISEGPIVGLVNGARSIYLDETPVQGTDGSMNFTGVTWEQRFGEHDQDYITGFPSVETEHAVGVELKASQPWTQSLSNLQLSGVRLRLGASALYQQNSDGDTTGFTVNYVVELSTDGSDYVPIITTAFNGKTTTGYQRSHRIDLPAAEEGWSIRVRRTTPDYSDAKIGDTTTVVSYTEVIDAKLQYPYTALVGIKIDASQFSNIPERAFRIRGRIIQVPSNYTPESRTYSGTWDGTFKLAWTDNPAWIYRDIIINDRYGLGRFISSDNVDKWELYQIAQYCDAMVSDGKGGQEPRFTCNLYLQSRADALQVLQDLASIFRGMAYYAGSEVVASADMPSDPVYTYTNANVIDGYFSRPGSSGSTRFSVAKVSWTDRDDFGAQKVEYVPNTKAIARYGIRETEITAFGCVSQGQAQRLGHYTLLTNQLETGTIQFSVGLDGVLARPGQIIRVADQHYAGKPIGGRVKASTTNSITVDDDLTVAAGDTLVVIQPNGTAQTRVIKTVTGRVITVTENFSAAPVTESVYAIETAEVVPETYRILTITENFGDDKLQYDVVAVQHNASKFAAIDSGAQIVTPPTTTLPGAVQAMPTNIQLSTYDAVKQGLTIATMRITWEPARSAQSYQVWWKKDSGDWVYAGITYTSSIEVSGIYTGTYTARVSAVGVNGNSSLWAYSEPTLLNGKEGLPPAITSLTTESLIFGIGIKWTFPPGAEDTQRTELWYSEAPQLDSATKLADLAYPQSDYTMQGLRAGQSFFFWARLVDRTGNEGPWFPQAPTVVNGQASADADDILDYLTGQITESQLGQELLGEIGKIGGDGPGSVNERLDDVRTDLSQQITDVSNTVTEVQSELQAQIDQIADLADSMPYKADETYTNGQGVLGADGIIYQALKNVPVNTPPPNTEFWLNVGQAVQTANGLAARVTTTETKITSIEGVNTAQANQITGLQTSLDGKADSSVVSSLSSRVTTAENTLSSQGTAITGLNNSLTVTNQNVTAAQNAANAANTLAGGKGKVLVQSAAPAAADQLAQNLWIDTTGNANTPKRWTGTAWAAVTDKAATDAATAAANALALAQTKADASAVNSLTTRVTSAEGTITSQGTRVTSLENTVNSPSTGLGTKASSAAVDALTSRVTQTETGLTSVSGQLTTLNNSIGDIGGQNLVYNPAFTKESTTPGVADGWLLDGPGAPGSSTGVMSLVPSFLVSSEKSQRVDVTNLTTSALYRSIRFADALTPKVTAGATVTASINMRGTAGLQVRIFIQARNASNGAIAAPASAMIPVTGGSQRISYSYPNLPANTANVQVFYRIYAGDSVSSGFVEFTRAQVELGAVASGWRDNGAVLASDQAATSTAVQSLQSTVTQQGTTLTSVGSRTTSLENAVNSTTDGLSTKASASALQTLGNRVTSVEGTLTSQSSDITNLKNTIGSAAPFVAGYAWEMTGSTRGWTANVSGATITAGTLFATVSKYTQIQATSSFGNLNGSENPFLRIRLRRKNTTRASAAMYWANEDGGLAEARRFNWPINLNTEDWQDIELDLSGHTGWNGKTGIYAIRLDMNNSGDANSVIDIGYIAVGRRSAAGSAQALSSLTTTVTQQGATISSQSQQITGLQTSVGNNTAQLQQQATTIADSAGKISAAYSVRLQVAQNGLNYVAGFGIGLDNSSGVLQSQFIVAADRFAVIRDVAGNVSSPFIIEGGQVFIADAVIKKATIVNGIIGQSISSATLTNYGVPVMIVDYNTGAIAINNKATNGKSIILREDGLFATSGGVTILELKV